MKCVFAKTLYTGESVLNHTYLCFDGPLIHGLSNAPAGEKLGEFEVITPAFIDPHSHIGMNRAGEPGAEGEGNEHLNSILARVDALDSLQMDDAAFADAVEMGVLYSCILPGSGNIIGGLSAVIRNYAPDSSAAWIKRAGVKAAFGHNPRSTTDWKGDRPTTRMGALNLLRIKLDEVRQKWATLNKATGKKKAEGSLTLAETVLRDLLEGKEVLRVHVHKIDDIAALLRLADEFALKVTVEHACDVNRPDIFVRLKEKDIPVTYGPLDAFAYKVELKHENWRNIRHLLESGVTFGLMSDHPVTPARNLLLQTRWFMRCGLSKQAAIEILCRNNAKILGISDRLGTLEKGKWASFSGWNGDPFDLTCHPVAVYGEGRCLYSNRTTQEQKT
jgi:imidazolonepropionase-like amidohydrolase